MISLCRIIIRHWDLIIGLAVKDLKVKYKSAFLGFLWSILTPLFLAFIFFIVFTRIIPMGIDKYPIFLLCALFPWNFMQLSISSGTTSIVTSGNLIKKIYFPREAIPFSVIFSNAYNFLLSILILLAILMLSGVGITLKIIYLPLVILCQMILTLGMIFLFSGLHTYFRDVKYIVEIFLLGWFYLTPIFYPLEVVPESLRFLYMVNPMAVLVNMYREILLFGVWPGVLETGYLILSSIFTCAIGLFVFRKYEPIFADIV
ncbi:MAG: ABC transporter permease [Candidatus Omnitrophica bacterium]|nr:ABC transporter permease [Candidatus Omnitrophota bacterium]